MQPEDRSIRVVPVTANAELLQRLRSASGHLQAVIIMVEAGEPCEAVLHQLGAVQAALGCAGRTLIRCQVQKSTDSLLDDFSPETRAQIVLRLSNLYSFLIKNQIDQRY